MKDTYRRVHLGPKPLNMATATTPVATCQAGGTQQVLDLLLACARTELTQKDAERIKYLAQQVLEWQHVFQLAKMHGTMPLVYRSLSVVCPQCVPDRAIDTLRNYYYATAAQNLSLTSELLELLELFDSDGISAIPIKGPVLAAAAYGSVAMREFSDLDIMVHREQLPRAVALLRARGYVEMRSATPDPEQYASSFECSSGSGRVALVDLHWELGERHFAFPFSLAECSQRLSSVSVAGSWIRTLTPEDTLLMLSMHGAKHCWSRLGWICDVAEFVRAQPGIDWSTLRRRASDSGLERILCLALFLAVSLLAAKLPREVESWIGSPAVNRLAATVCRWLYTEKDGSGIPLERECFYVGLRERRHDQLMYVLRALPLFVKPNARDEEVVALPKAFAFFYWLLRPARLLTTYGLDSFRRQ